MGIKLESIEIKNIRSHSHFLFKPKETGITVISGENGTGKSSIVNSLAWTLFSTKPRGWGKAQNMMKEGVPFAKDQFYSEVILQINDEYLKVRKTIKSKSGSAECMVWSSVDQKKWNVEAGPAVTSAEPYIKKRLQMNEKDFLASIFIQQKEVDALILDDQKNRARVIEKLTGISSITEAVNIAREEYKTIQKTIGDSNINEDGLKELKEIKKENDKKILALEEKCQKLKKEISELTEKKDVLKEIVDQSEGQRETINNLENKINILTIKVDDKRQLLENLMKDKKVKKAQFSKLTQNYNSDELLKKLNGLEENLDNLNVRIGKNDFDFNSLKEKQEMYTEILEKSQIKDIETAKEKEKTNLQNKRKNELQSKKLEQDKYSFIGLINSLDNAIKTIETHDGECPTCLQKVPDTKSTVSNLTEQKESVKENIAKIDEKLEKNELLKDKIETNIEKFKLLIEAFNIKEINARLEELAKEKKDKEAEKIAITKEIMGIRKLYAESNNYDSIKEEYNNLLDRAQKENKELEKLEKELATAKSSLKNSKMPSIDEINKNRKQLDTFITELFSKRETMIKIESNIEMEKEKNNSINKEITQLEADLKKYKKLLGSVEVSLNTVKVLEEFRIERIKNSATIIETYASEFLSKFTNGVFSGMKLDSKFNASVLLPDGTKREIGLLSGGEVSAAAIALRFAIAFLLSSDDEQNLLILDEVLTAQDTVRVQSILESIKETLKGQVILIAHNDSVKSIADKVIEL